MRSEESGVERDLRDALRRKTPSPGFVSRVVARLPVEHEHVRATRLLWRPLASRWVAAGLALFVLSGGSWATYRHWQYFERGRVAREQLMLALRITGSKLQLAGQRVQEIGADRPRERRVVGTEHTP